MNCGCAEPKQTGRYYWGKEACRLCNRVIDKRERRRVERLTPPPRAQLETIDRGTCVTIAANVYRANPHLTNNQVYNKLAEQIDNMPTITTWMNGWATEARKMSGTKPIAGRPAA